jgi:hypothetical protein
MIEITGKIIFRKWTQEMPAGGLQLVMGYRDEVIGVLKSTGWYMWPGYSIEYLFDPNFRDSLSFFKVFKKDN